MSANCGALEDLAHVIRNANRLTIHTYEGDAGEHICGKRRIGPTTTDALRQAIAAWNARAPAMEASDAEIVAFGDAALEAARISLTDGTFQIRLRAQLARFGLAIVRKPVP